MFLYVVVQKMWRQILCNLRHYCKKKMGRKIKSLTYFVGRHFAILPSTIFQIAISPLLYIILLQFWCLMIVFGVEKFIGYNKIILLINKQNGHCDSRHFQMWPPAILRRYGICREKRLGWTLTTAANHLSDSNGF